MGKKKEKGPSNQLTARHAPQPAAGSPGFAAAGLPENPPPSPHYSPSPSLPSPAYGRVPGSAPRGGGRSHYAHRNPAPLSGWRLWSSL